MFVLFFFFFMHTIVCLFVFATDMFNDNKVIILLIFCCWQKIQSKALPVFNTETMLPTETGLTLKILRRPLIKSGGKDCGTNC